MMTLSVALSALAGGALIGLAAALFMLLNGRIAGISGVLGAVVEGQAAAWRLAFIAGLVVSAPLAALVAGSLPPVTFETPLWLLVPAGLLVGVGTRLAGGCTSGHGVCGLARLSPRSLVATGLFMAAGAATVFIVRHGMGL